MSLVPHKYTPAEMSAHELESTFAAREHTVDYLLKSLRDQIHSGTLSSFVITGPRGVGKSTIIQMVALRIRRDAELSAAWIPVVFPEEQFNMVSLRDTLAAILHALGKEQIPAAQEWFEKVEAEPNEEQSQQLAVTGLRKIVRQTGKRLILFIENLDQLLEEHLDDQMKGTLRRLLMTEPFMMIVGSTVHVFDSLKSYDEAFFNYFGQVALDRLNPKQVSELLRKRAEFDQNEIFLRELPKQQAKVRTLVHLTGGNPRFVLMLYELLSLQKVTSIVQYLRRLVDELTPLLKDEMETLPPQQRKIIHALMEKGGTAQPTNLVGPTRLPLNAINTQLKRLKDAQIVEVLGGGKGRAANYTVPDKLFSIWYQMRYLSQNRRRIELFVDVLRIWFEEEERVKALRSLAEKKQTDTPHLLRECAATAEYFAASLKGTKHELVATDLCVSSWLKADLKEAAIAYADLGRANASELFDEAKAHMVLAGWCSAHDDPRRAIAILDQVLAKPKQIDVTTRALALVLRANTRGPLGEAEGAIADASAVLKLTDAPKMAVTMAHFIRGITKNHRGDKQGAIDDYTSALALGGVSKEMIANALIYRGGIKAELRDDEGALKDFNAVIELEITNELATDVLISRGLTKSHMGDYRGAISDFTTVAETKDISKEWVARALVNRGVAKNGLGDVNGAIADYDEVVGLDGVSKEGIARALVNRGGHKIQLENIQGAFNDYCAAIKLDSLPKELALKVLYCRGLCYFLMGDLKAATTDWSAVIDQSVEANDFLADVVQLAFGTLWNMSDQSSAIGILERLSTHLNTLAKDSAREVALRVMSSLASPEMKDAWLIAWRNLITNLKPEIAEAVKFLEPVCNVLEGKDRTLLDALPPEQREFALEVLAKFEPKPKPESAKAQNKSYSKRARSK